MLTNPAKAKLEAGEPALGLAVRTVRNPDIARIARASGHDFLFIDGQHAVFNLETITAIATLALAVGVAPLVRVRGVDDPDAALLLDSGASGIVFPDVNTAKEARRAVERCRFPPVGRRSVGASFPQFDLAGVPLAEAVPQIEAATLVVAMIETRAGVENVEAIAAVPGIDVLHVGTNDLAVDLGLAGQLDAPPVVAAVARVIAAARANGKWAGMGGNRDPAKQAEAIRRGALFITTQSDTALLATAAAAWTRGVREALGKAT